MPIPVSQAWAESLGCGVAVTGVPEAANLKGPFDAADVTGDKGDHFTLQEQSLHPLPG